MIIFEAFDGWISLLGDTVYKLVVRNTAILRFFFLCVVLFDINLLLLLSGDIELNPGPITGSSYCSVCLFILFKKATPMCCYKLTLTNLLRPSRITC